MPEPTDVSSNVLRPDGQPARSSQLQEWLVQNILPGLAAILIGVLAWNVNQLTDAVREVEVSVNSGQVTDARLEGKIEAVEGETDNLEGRVKRLENIHDR